MRKQIIVLTIFILSFDSMAQIDSILKIKNKTTAIIELGQSLWNKSKDDKNFESLNEYEKTVLFIEMLESQVNNGGFDQYFFNSSGDYVYETVDALKRINAPKTAEILTKAINQFPVQPVPKYIIERRNLMTDLSKTVSTKWEELDSKFFLYEENLEELVIEFVKNNKDRFD